MFARVMNDKVSPPIPSLVLFMAVSPAEMAWAVVTQLSLRQNEGKVCGNCTNLWFLTKIIKLLQSKLIA